MCQKMSVFRFWCSMRFADFSFFSIWFSVFVKNTQRFFGFGTQCVFWFLPIFFPIWTYLGVQFCIWFSVLAYFVCGFVILDEVFFGFAVPSIPQCPPLQTFHCYQQTRHCSWVIFDDFLSGLETNSSH